MNEEHPLKAELPIEVIVFGNSMFVNKEHPSKAESPIEVTLLGNSTLVSLLQL